MNSGKPIRAFVLLSMAALASATCEKRGEPRRDTRPANSAAKQETAPSNDADPTGAPRSHEPADSGADSAGDAVLNLTGLTMTIPDGWIAEPAQKGAMAPKAVFTLPAAGDGAAGGTIRVTFFPGMKDMDEANIARWVAQVKRADGTPSTRDDAEISARELGPVRLTVVDITGKVTSDMGAVDDAGTEDHRMITAIINHPEGPHFVKAVGGPATIEKWQTSIEQFLESAKVR